ncbi:hypothetical protein [Ureibacillus sp. FSL K6-0786]|uniref:hypothetical protein n=1 Tax=Ureibacillus sp. FSL K6-0786 TaxID=2954607 RepID=UPI0030DA5EB4
MEIYVRIGFSAEYSLKSELESFLRKLEIPLNFPDKPKRGTEVEIKVPIRINGVKGIDRRSYIISY